MYCGCNGVAFQYPVHDGLRDISAECCFHQWLACWPCPASPLPPGHKHEHGFEEYAQVADGLVEGRHGHDYKRHLGVFQGGQPTGF